MAHPTAHRMRPYVVRQGDYLTKLAATMGFDRDAVWNDDANRELRDRRPNHDILQPGDVLYVPTPQAETGPQVSPNTHNRFKARIPTVDVKLRLRGAGNAALASKAYEVYGTGRLIEGTTDGEGVAAFSVPVRVRTVSLVLTESRQAYALRIGDMDPIEETTGVRKRLEHLGYLSARPEDGTDLALREGVRRFQASAQLTASGEIDQATRDALVRAHGS
jgi:hypothetical protein